MRFIDLSLRTKFIIIMLAIISGLLLLVTSTQIIMLKQTYVKELDKRINLMTENLTQRAKNLSDTLAINIENALASFNLYHMTNQINNTAQEREELAYIILMDNSRIAHIHTLYPQQQSTQLSNQIDIFASSQTSATTRNVYSENVEILEFIVPINSGIDQWGVLRLGYSLEILNSTIMLAHKNLEEQITSMIQRIIFAAIVFSFFSLLLVYYLAGKLTKPLIDLTYVANNLTTDYEMTAPLPQTDSKDEIGTLNRSFSVMYKYLRTLINELKNHKLSLEQKVSERTQELNNAVEELKNSQTQLIHAEKMAALGQLISGIAHEINSPLGAIMASNSNICNSFKHIIDNFHLLHVLTEDHLIDKFKDLICHSSQRTKYISTREERKIHQHILQKLSKYGIANVNDITNNLMMMHVYTDIEQYLAILSHPQSHFFLQAAQFYSSIRVNSTNISTAVDSTGKIVFALKNYAHIDIIEEKRLTNISENIEMVLTLYQHQLTHNMTLIKNFYPVPKIECYDSSLAQVWTNMLYNSIQATKGKGKIIINISQSIRYNNIRADIIDNGCGIDKEIQDQIFNPFFTTKPQGEGTGIGLDICKKIIDKHNGRIDVASSPGNTKFSIYLPLTESAQKKVAQNE